MLSMRQIRITRLIVFTLSWLILPTCGAFAETHPAAAPAEKPRMIVLTDIEADPDDAQTLVRLLLYSNCIDIEGIVATTSTHMRERIYPESIREIIRRYGKVRDNLLEHEAGYPTESELLAIVKNGLPEYGLNAVGKGKNSEGSEWIIRSLKSEDQRPLWISVWGGTNVLAQALFQLREDLGNDEAKLASLLAKLRIYTISDQDDSGIWIRRNFPELFYIVSPGGYGNSIWGGINERISGIDNTSISNGWLAENIQQGHGPLGAAYPDVAYAMEGDTPSWLGLIPNGLNVPDRPDWGGWGGRYEFYRPELADIDPKGFTGGVPVEEEPRAIWTNAVDTWHPLLANDFGRTIRWDEQEFSGYRVTLWRWRDDFQNDFAARMDWCMKSYAEANHPPVPALAHEDVLTVHSGEGFVLDATGTTDPDGDSLSFVWFNYPEAGTLKTPIPCASAENLCRSYFVAPKVTSPQTAHFILRVTDKGTPSLSRYKRVIVHIIPR
ncbi:MAG: DUF1593 domain-containing protein [Opitutales bacterium]|nr:DUF1593 domain-containing protein [Opitutales bacterium]